MKTILLVDDDKMILDSVGEILRNKGYRVWMAENSSQMRERMKLEPIDLLILDIQLEGETGYAICKKVKAEQEIPILFLTAYEGEDELVKAFRSGGDDYLTKPFRLRELLVRVEALLRRSAGKENAILRCENLVLERESRVLYKAGRICSLTDIESKILLCLMENYPHTVPKSSVEEFVWGMDSEFMDPNTLSVHMSRLRKKLEDEYIQTISGRGYRWNRKVERR